jgi:hypothetical protein
MINLPNTPNTFFELLSTAIRRHFATFRKMILLIVFLVIVKDAYVYLGGMPTNQYVYSVVAIVMTLLILYLLVAMLYTAHCVFNNENINWRTALSDTLTRMGRVILAFVIFIVVPILLFFIGEWIGRWLMAGDPKPYRYSGLILVLVVGVPVMIAYLYYLFTIPLIVSENFGIWQAFKHSPQLIGQQGSNVVRVFGVYAIGVAIWLLISPDTLHGHLIKMYKLSAPYDFVVFSVALPILMNLIILMRNDLKLRKEVRDADSK